MLSYFYMMNASEWAITQKPSTPPNDFYCQTRDVAQARVEHLRLTLEKNGWDENKGALIASVIGELANNCFDHNLGTWRDVQGCWLEYQTGDKIIEITVADRGQGILNSLRQVRPELQEHKKALFLAFTESISGRAPESRGNGLKFVLKSLNQLSAKFLFHSGDTKLKFETPVDINELNWYLVNTEEIVGGTYCKIVIKNI